MNKLFTKEYFRQATAFAAAGARGKCVSLQDGAGINWTAIFRMAMSQSVLPIVGCALMKGSDMGIPNEMYDQVIEHTRMVAAKNQIKKQRIMWLINELESAGINVKLIKGYAVADCYDQPECRRSEDTDLLIQPEQEQAAYDVLRNLGFRVDRRNATSHHAVCQHPKHGMVELHVQLYDELIHEGWLHVISEDELIREQDIRVHSSYGEYTTLGYTDHALFLAIHMVKHFIGVGMNIRMMLDVALFLTTHKADIDFVRFWRILKELHFDCVVNCVLTMMADTEHFEFAEFPGAERGSDEQVNLLIADLITISTATRKSQEDNAYYEYSKVIMQKSMGRVKYSAYMIKWTLRNTWSQMWPAKEQLFALYGMDKKKNFLLPWLRLRRVFELPVQKIKAGITPKRLLSSQVLADSAVANRLRVFKELKMI